MRTHCFCPLTETPAPSVILYSEIYQMTGPIARTAAFIAGQVGFLDIGAVVAETMAMIPAGPVGSLAEVVAIDAEARAGARARSARACCCA